MDHLKTWDVFISHASEDKDTIVRALAERLDALQVRVWYDEFSLKVGDSLSSSIDLGLRESRFGIVVLSKAFLQKRWTEYEFRSLLSRQVNGERVILPIWHGVTKEEVKVYSLFLADIFALNTDTYSLEQIVAELVSVIRPDVFRQMRLESFINQVIRKGRDMKVPRSKLQMSLNKRSHLTDQQLTRAKIVYYGIGQHLNKSFQDYINLFELDLYPERELQCWELINACYMEYQNAHPHCSYPELEDVFQSLLSLSIGRTPETVIAISDEDVAEIAELWKRNAR